MQEGRSTKMVAKAKANTSALTKGDKRAIKIFLDR